MRRFQGVLFMVVAAISATLIMIGLNPLFGGDSYDADRREEPAQEIPELVVRPHEVPEVAPH